MKLPQFTAEHSLYTRSGYFQVPGADGARGQNITPQLTRVFRSDDGKFAMVCVYDDFSGELGYCDIL
jgi:hypothetical protein